MKTQKGITLIALIITIIVMLILVGVSVSIALNSELFKAAQGAAQGTEAHKENETKLSSGNITIIDKDGNEKEVDINSFGNVGETLDPKDAEMKAQGYTHKLVDGTESYYIKNDTTWGDLVGRYEAFTTEYGDMYYKGNYMSYIDYLLEGPDGYGFEVTIFENTNVISVFRDSTSYGCGEEDLSLVEL